MDREFALATVQTWRVLVDDPPLAQQADAHFWRALTELIPDGSPAAALKIDGEAKIIALADRTIVELMYEDGDPASLRVSSRTIEPATAVTEMVESLVPFGSQHMGGLARIRTWTFRIAGDYELAWETRQVMSGGFGGERQVSAEERLARYIAAATGWQLPSRDAAGPDWD